MARIDFVTGAPLRYMPLVNELAMTPDRVEAVLSAHAGSSLTHAPADGGWPPARVLGHMLSYARHNGRFIFMIANMTDPVRPPWDEDAEIAAEGWLNYDAARFASALDAETTPTVQLLSHTPDASWGRPGQHPTDGRRSLRQQLQAHLDHLSEHIAQLDALLAR
ncbi:MAG: DinB family protein [Dehalococcoidia bacterium]